MSNNNKMLISSLNVSLFFSLYQLVVVPFYIPLDESPGTSTLFQNWAVGLVFLKLWVRRQENHLKTKLLREVFGKLHTYTFNSHENTKHHPRAHTHTHQMRWVVFGMGEELPPRIPGNGINPERLAAVAREGGIFGGVAPWVLMRRPLGEVLAKVVLPTLLTLADAYAVSGFSIREITIIFVRFSLARFNLMSLILYCDLFIFLPKSMQRH
jgi:hypothetical protein